MRIFYLFIFLTQLLFSSPLSNNSTPNYEEYEKEVDLASYQKAYQKATQLYKKKILKNFPKADISSTSRWVSYINNFKTKNVIDFENEKIIIQTYAKSMSEAREKISQRFIKLLQMTIEDAFDEDFVEQHVISELQLNAALETKKELISDIYTRQNTSDTRNYIKKAPIKKSRFKNSNIYTMEIGFPPQAMLKKAKSYKQTIGKLAYENHLPMELIFAVIHSESSFNPMARSRTPAFGLMQIVPQTAGIDSYYFLYGKRKLLSARYLYNEERNIKIGTTYLHLLFYKFFNDINDPLKRLYATIAAYNCGAGNLAKTFVGTADMKLASQKINDMEVGQMYDYLLENLPFNETKNYLQKVNERIFAYRTWILESRL